MLTHTEIVASPISLEVILLELAETGLKQICWVRPAQKHGSIGTAHPKKLRNLLDFFDYEIDDKLLSVYPN